MMKIGFQITSANPDYHYVPLPQYIKIKNPNPGEVTIFEKRSFPKAARIHKKREDNDPHRFFLSELMLYTGYTDEKQLGCDEERKCMALYLRKKNDIEFVKRLLMPFTQGVEEARHHVQQAMQEERDQTNNIGNELDPEQEKEIEECQEIDEVLHPEFVQVNPDDQNRGAEYGER